MKVLVCGGRDFTDKALLYATLDNIHGDTPIECILHGDAKGADKLANDWAIEHDVGFIKFVADWDRFGRSAGPKRNAHMLSYYPSLVVAFPGGKGTRDMVTRAKNAVIPVIEIVKAFS